MLRKLSICLSIGLVVLLAGCDMPRRLFDPDSDQAPQAQAPQPAADKASA